MTPPSSALPARCDVLVVGAGPAGSACAQVLAGAGRDVLLVDQHDFPRDKACGDGLIPDAHAALAKLGVLDEVMDHARHVGHVRCVAPRAGHIDVPGSLAVLPRKVLDHLLTKSACRHGARLATPWRFEAPLLDGDRVTGARLRGPAGTHEVLANWVVMATGAVPQAMIAAGLCERRTPSGVALRGYVHHPGLGHRIDQLQVVWHPRLEGGYGWIFPAPGDVYNIGAGLTHSHAEQPGGRGRMQEVNLRDTFAAFAEVYPPARELLAGGTMLGELKGAPLRCSLQGARRTRPGMLATGEAVGSTYDFTGEGIGKALETGMLAAHALLGGGTEPEVRGRYEAALAALEPRFGLYATAGHVNRRPWLVDLVVWRARRSAYLQRRMAGVLDESQNPGRLLSWRGVVRLMFG